MSSEFLTVETAAAVLQLHPKTVLRFIREGRLRASKVGKQYRILRSDLNSFAGAPESPPYSRSRATSIVDIEDVDAVLLQRLTAGLLGASNGRAHPAPSISVNIAHDPVRGSAKVIVVAAPADTAVLLNIIDATLES